MARPLRITYEGAVHHVTVRGNDRRRIFRTDGDREHFINKLAESVRLYDVRLYLFALMQNHIHLVLETPKGNLSRFMHRLQTAYTVYFQRKGRLKNKCAVLGVSVSLDLVAPIELNRSCSELQ